MDTLPEVRANPHWLGCRCTLCGRDYGPHAPEFVCADCGIDGILDARYDLDALGYTMKRKDPFPQAAAGGMWRFAPLLPVAPAGPHPCWSLGATANVPAPRLARRLGVRQIVLKDDTGLPSASLKDRAAAVAIARARQLGLDHLACASTGNAAASLAVLGARAGMRCTIFVPAAAPRAKLAQLLLHGAEVVRVDGTYDQAFDLSLTLIDRHHWYSRNCAHNPLLVEGKKTAALELCADLTDGFTAAKDTLPEAVFVPVGDGCIISSVGKAFAQLRELGLIDRVPRLIGVQAAGAAPLAEAWARGRTDVADLSGRAILERVTPVTPHTLADSISVGVPRNRVKAWRAVAGAQGEFVAVPDEAILEAIALLAQQAGVFAEPSGATGLAGVLAARERGLVGAGDRVAVLVTGHGLKDPEAALGQVRIPEPVPPSGA